MNDQVMNLIVSIRLKYRVLSLLVAGTTVHEYKLFEINDLEQTLWLLTGKSFREFEEKEYCHGY